MLPITIHSVMLEHMTDNQRWLSKKYIAYRLFTNMWFMGAVWFYFYRIFITDQQIGLLDGLAFAIGLLAEVPSGALADKFGHAKMVRIGQLSIAAGLLIQGFGSSFVPLFVGQTIMMIGMSLVSGADDALFFDKLKFKENSIHWRKLVMRGSQVALAGTLVAIMIGGWLHTIDPRIPWILTGLSLIVATIIIWPVKDARATPVRQKVMVEIKEYLYDIKTGFAQFRLPKLWHTNNYRITGIVLCNGIRVTAAGAARSF